MNTCVAKKAPTNKTYYKSVSLDARVKVAARIYMAGYHFFWSQFMAELEMDISPNFNKYLFQRDKRKFRMWVREHLYSQKEKQQEREYAKLRKEPDRRFKNVAKTLEYIFMVGFYIDDSPSPKKKKERVIYNHTAYGCVGIK